ncbi:MAG TPA: hypothetical protein PLZ51_10550, partial [Aggregatilineales bacterium]|nr:hypothetical protein [Aggregatilineales bacterium]
MNNFFAPGLPSRGQPTTFLAGIYEDVFSVVFDGNPLTWFLQYNGYTLSITASNADISCDGIVPDVTPVVTPDVITNLPIIPQVDCVDN